MPEETRIWLLRNKCGLDRIGSWFFFFKKYLSLRVS